MSPGGRALPAAVALMAVAALATMLMSGPRRESPRLPPASTTAARPVPRPARPDAREILAHAAALGLTPAQRGRLEALDRRWRAGERALLDAVEDARRDMSALSADGRAVRLRDIQERAAGFGELSAELRQARARHAEDALGVLTETQGQRLLEMRTTTMRRGESNEARTN
jgi:type IV pilus biogenesis protein CpaD/CtpE